MKSILKHQEKYHRRSIRVKNYDYSQFGSYFFTICVQRKICWLGDVKKGVVQLSSIGEIAKKHWMEIQNHFQNVILDEFVVMPNHLHGIIYIQPVGHKILCPYETNFKKSFQNQLVRSFVHLNHR